MTARPQSRLRAGLMREVLARIVVEYGGRPPEKVVDLMDRLIDEADAELDDDFEVDRDGGIIHTPLRARIRQALGREEGA